MKDFNWKQRRYYSMRTGKNPQSKGIDLRITLVLFKDLYSQFDDEGYFQEAFGYDCVDAGFVPGLLGENIEARARRVLRKDGLYPIEDKCLQYSEDDLFDIIEFLYDCVSKPIKGYYHDFNNCGMHYSEFNRGDGQERLRSEVNEILQDYSDGFELSPNGEILMKGDAGLDTLFQAALVSSDQENVNARVEAATAKFRRHRSTLEDRYDAVRDLVGVLEYLRPKLRQVIDKKDDGDLFNLANSFGIRHHRDDQKTDYDRAIWYSWMFYYYLATIHAVTRLLEKSEQ